LKRGFHGSWRLVPVLVLGLGSLFGGSSLVWGTGVSDLVQGYGLAPVEPPRPAADFALPSAGGGERSLSDFAGNWVILTFWASWCGPCRTELPSLERLHRSHGNRGIVVLGVSVDENRTAADAFAQQLGLTFPQLWDAEGRVGSLYQASAIPMSFLVDPQGGIVAMARGARDWTQMADLMDSLIGRVPPDPQAQAVYAENIQLPSVLDPPTADLQLSNQTPRVGQEFYLDIRLRWAGHMEEYMPQPPRVHLPEGVVQKGVTASTDSRDGAQVVVYRVTLQADEAGAYALDPVELRYRPRYATEETSTQILGPTVEIQPRTLLGLRPRTLALSVGGVALTALVGLAARRRWRAAKRSEPSGFKSQYEQMMTRYTEARSLRMQGDGAGFALALLGLLAQLREPDESESREAEKLEESLRYGGQVPPVTELDRLEREVGRRLEAMRPNPDAAAREALLLQDGNGASRFGVEEKA